MIILRTLGEKLEYYSVPMLRIGMAIVYLWFGVSQVMNPGPWTGYLPDFMSGITENLELIVTLNGILEIVLGTLLLIGLFTRISAWILAVHMLGITISVGYNSIGVRDFGITIATFAIAMTRNDPLRLDNKIRVFSKKKDPISFD